MLVARLSSTASNRNRQLSSRADFDHLPLWGMLHLEDHQDRQSVARPPARNGRNRCTGCRRWLLIMPNFLGIVIENSLRDPGGIPPTVVKTRREAHYFRGDGLVVLLPPHRTRC